MKKLLKLVVLILLSLSVYFIYQKTKDKNENILVLGDSLALGINSYGIYDYSYVDYYQEYLKDKKVIINKNHCKKNLTMEELTERIKIYPELKRDLKEATEVFLNIGYTDLIYKLSLEEEKTPETLNKIIKEMEEEYQNLRKEINHYYKKNMIIIGYYASNKKDYYTNQGIRKLNSFLAQEEKSIYIDTYSILKNTKKYFSNPNSYYPNSLGYQKIADEIIRKTLEKSENI